MPLEKQVDKAVQEVRLNWQQSINQLPPKERENLKNNIKNKNFPQCSTTVLIGHLNLNGDFIGYRSGDSKMLLFKVSPTNEISFSEKSFLDKNDESDDRVFFNLDVNDNGEFFIRTNHLRFQTITDDNIKTIISFSDGIGANTEQLLKEEYKNEPDKVKKDISSRSYTEEFLYDKNGALVFYFQKAENDDQMPVERRIYFSLGKAVRIVEDEKKRDKPTVKDAATVKEIMADSAKIKEIFNGSIKL